LADNFWPFPNVLCSVQSASQVKGLVLVYCVKTKVNSNVTLLFVMMCIFQFNSTAMTYENDVLYFRPGNDTPVYQ